MSLKHKTAEGEKTGLSAAHLQQIHNRVINAGVLKLPRDKKLLII